MSIWFKKDISLHELVNWGNNTMSEHLDIKFTEIGDDFMKATMPVDHRTHQPYGLLHGGASVALAETIGSVASALVVDREKFRCVGIEINANHIRSVRNGIVTALCKPLHLGSTTHVWDIRIHNESDHLVCVCRLTVAVLVKRSDVG